jgi:hypothetical protein
MQLSNSPITRKRAQPAKFLLTAALVFACLIIALLVRAQTFPDASRYASDPAAMLAGYRHVEVT